MVVMACLPLRSPGESERRHYSVGRFAVKLNPAVTCRELRLGARRRLGRRRRFESLKTIN